MANSRRWWDCFWTENAPVALISTKEPETWEELIWKVGLEFWYELFESFAPGRKMLECGCGSARVSLYMAQRGYQCTLLDSSEQALSVAKRNFASLSLRGQFILGDMNALCLRGQQFDVVYSGGVLEFLDDLERPIKEMVRILKPAGIFAANIVPPKFSIQSIANIERTAAYSVRNLARGRFGEVFRRVRQIPCGYQVKPWSLKDYVRTCEEAGLTSATGLVTTPFPALALPRVAHRLYARLMRALLPQWRRFNGSRSRWTELWGIAYTIHGIKRR